MNRTETFTFDTAGWGTQVLEAHLAEAERLLPICIKSAADGRAAGDEAHGLQVDELIERNTIIAEACRNALAARS